MSPERTPSASVEKQEAGSSRVLSVGDRVSVLRNSKEGSPSAEKWLDRSDWRVVETNPEVTKVQRVTAEGTATESFGTAELTALQERLDEKTRRDLGEEAVEISGISQPEVSAVETKKEMLDRFAREYQAEKSRLYAELRGVEQTSHRAAQLENLIKLAKEDIERVDKQLRNL